jgi:UDP-glucose 4-epimerase
MASKKEKRSSGRRKAGSTVAEQEGEILVTGISGNLGRLLARRLHRVARVVGIDRRPFRNKPKDIDVVQMDLRRKKVEEVFRTRDIRAVVHLSILHDPRSTAYEHHTYNIVGTRKIIDLCEKHGVGKFVFLSTANVYGPRPENNQFLTEDSPLLGDQDFHEIRDIITVDHLAQSFFWKKPDINTVILRPVHILGRVHNAPSNYLRLRYPPKVMGFDPMVQVIHEEDVVRAIILALKPEIRGVFNVVGPGEVPLSRVFKALGKTPLPIPSLIGEPLLRALWKWRLTSFPPPEVDYIRYQCTVDGSRARDILGYEPRHSLLDTIRCLET